MARSENGRLLEERAIEVGDAPKHAARKGRPARSVTVNLVESPLGWLFARGHLSRRQFDRDAESALGWPARAGKLVLTLALDRVAAFYRIP